MRSSNEILRRAPDGCECRLDLLGAVGERHEPAPERVPVGVDAACLETVAEGEIPLGGLQRGRLVDVARLLRRGARRGTAGASSRPGARAPRRRRPRRPPRSRRRAAPTAARARRTAPARRRSGGERRRAAASPSGEPVYVPPWTTRFSASQRISSREPPNAATAMPPPITFPSAVMSGVTPYRSCAPPAASLKPVITSSKMTRAPAARVVETSCSRNPGRGSSTPPDPGTTSQITAASRSPAAVDRLGERLGVVPRHRPERLHDPGRDPGRVGSRRPGRRARPDPGGEVIGPAVVVPLELDHELAAGGGAGETDGRLGRLGARVREPQLLDPGNELGDELGRLAGEAVREGDVPAEPRHGLLDRLPDERRARARRG